MIPSWTTEVTFAQLAALADLPLSSGTVRVKRLVDAGALRPVDDRGGTGRHRRYTLRDVFVLRACLEAAKCLAGVTGYSTVGLSPDGYRAVGEAIDQLRHGSRWLLVHPDGTVTAVADLDVNVAGLVIDLRRVFVSRHRLEDAGVAVRSAATVA